MEVGEEGIQDEALLEEEVTDEELQTMLRNGHFILSHALEDLRHPPRTVS